jgi:type IV pilus assembly protein PilC
MGLVSSQISTKSLVPLCRQLATSYDAGIPILKSLEILQSESRDRQTQQVLTSISEDIQKGATLGDAARSQEKYLPPFFIELLSTGEMGGRLDVMLRDLAQYYEDRQTLQRKIVTSLIYPVIQLNMAWFLGSFALMIIGSLNLESSAAFNFDTFFAEYLAFQAKAAIVFGILVVVAIVLARMGILKYIWGWFSTYVWPFRGVTRKFGLARFFRSMSLLVGSGMNIKSCIQNSAAVTANPYMQKDLAQAVGPVSDGATLTQAFGTSRFLNATAREMLMVGEQSGELEKSLLKVSEYNTQEATHALKKLTTVMAMLISLAVCGVVGYIIISFYMKYFGILDSLL